MAQSLKISPLSSLNFSHLWKRPFQIPTEYDQRFLQYDRIRVQYSARPDLQLTFLLVNTESGEQVAIVPRTVSESSDVAVYEILMDNLSIGRYYVQISTQLATEEVLEKSSCFCVLEEINCPNVLFSYNHYRNEFQTIFATGDYFDFRIEGAFMPHKAEFTAETEDFRDQRWRTEQLSALPGRVDVLTFGGFYGAPNWVADKINRILSLRYVMIDGVRHVRSDGSIPEMVFGNARLPLYIYDIRLERDETYVDVRPPVGGGDFNGSFSRDFFVTR